MKKLICAAMAIMCLSTAIFMGCAKQENKESDKKDTVMSEKKQDEQNQDA